jgi:hypothetical protein
LEVALEVALWVALGEGRCRAQQRDRAAKCHAGYVSHHHEKTPAKKN